MRSSTFAAAALSLLLAAPAGAADLPASEIQPRVEHHVREVTRLSKHFEALIAARCPRFATVDEWNIYADAEIDRMLLLAAHAEQAWVEAKRTGDDDVRRFAKAPRRRLEEATQITDKLAACAQTNGTTFSAGLAYRRIERELRARQAEIALPR